MNQMAQVLQTTEVPRGLQFGEPRGVLIGWELPGIRQPIGFNTEPGGAGGAPIFMAGEGHRITIAPSGTGKTTGPVLADLVTHDGPAVVIDPTGAVFAMTAAHRRRLGPVHCLDPSGVTKPAGGGPGRLDPLDLVDASSESALIDAMALAEALVVDAISTDPHWAIRARQVVAGLALYVAQHAPKKKRTIATLFDILCGNINEMAAILVGMELSGKHCRRVAGMIQAMPERERGSVLSMACRDLGVLGTPQARRATANSTIKVADLTAGVPMTVYIVIPPHHLAALRPLLRAWLTVVITAMGRRTVLPEKNTLVVVDEAGQLSGLESIKTAVTLMRNYGLQMHLLYQDIQQLKSAFPRDWPTIANNCAATLMFGFRSQRIVDGALEVSGYAGDAALLGQPDDTAILCQPGRAARLIRRASVFKDRLLAAHVAENPRYMRPQGSRHHDAHAVS